MYAIEVWSRILNLCNGHTTGHIEPSQPHEVSDDAADPEDLLAAELEDRLEKYGLVIGLLKDKRKIIIDVFPDQDKKDFQPLTARMALGYKQSDQILKYFRLDERREEALQ